MSLLPDEKPLSVLVWAVESWKELDPSAGNGPVPTLSAGAEWPHECREPGWER